MGRGGKRGVRAGLLLAVLAMLGPVVGCSTLLRSDDVALVDGVRPDAGESPARHGAQGMADTSMPAPESRPEPQPEPPFDGGVGDGGPEPHPDTQDQDGGDLTRDTGSPDQDGDGIPDARDACRAGLQDGPDLDGDGCKDLEDGDVDGDRIRNVEDPCPRDIRHEPDIDGDGCGATEDLDDDGDGIEDDEDACPMTPKGAPDTDRDGCEDDVDGDDDDDGIPDELDGCRTRAIETTDADADGCDDTLDDDDDDGDEVVDTLDPCPGTPKGALDTDADGCSDAVDLDDDNDGIPDEDELRLQTDPTDPNDRPRVLLVSATAPGTPEDGLTWATAYRSLQTALTAMASLQADGPVAAEIWTAAGTYYPDEGVGRTDNDPGESFALQDNLRILGGFSGVPGEGLNDRDPQSSVTILSGDLQQDDTPSGLPGVPANAAGINGVNAQHVVVADNNDASAGLEGFTVAGGDSCRNGDGLCNGAGLRALNGAPSLAHLVFRSNMAPRGGGVAIDGNVAVALSDTLFMHNGLSGQGEGAALYLNSADATLRNLVFRENDAGTGSGAAAEIRYGSASFTGLSVENNLATNGGGLSLHESRVRIEDGHFIGNRASMLAGAIIVQSSDLTVVGATFKGNQSLSTAGGIYVMSQHNRSRITLINTEMSGNYAGGHGGAFRFNNTAGLEVLITNSSIVSNYAGGWGGGFRADGCRLEVHNSVVWHNDCASCNSPNALVDGDPFFNSLVEGRTSTAQGNLDASMATPVFVATVKAAAEARTDLDSRQLAGSATLDAGNNTAPISLDDQSSVIADLPTDARNGTRVLGARVDIGAYEGIR